MVAMFSLFIVRYLLKISVPPAIFLGVAMIPIFRGTTNEQLAFVASCIPFSVAFQYKYAILILTVVILWRNNWRLKRAGLFVVVMFMMFWELCHAFYGHFSYVEYLRDFAELILLGVVTSISLDDIDYKLIIRSLAISVVGVCLIMLIMQLQKHNFNLITVFARSAHSFRFGQSNMGSGAFALNFNANNLGFICNLSACGCLLLISRKDYQRTDMILAIFSFVFAMLTLSRAAIVCSVMIFVSFLLSAEGKSVNRIFRSITGIAITTVVVVLLWVFIPAVFENLLERFQRADVWNGRGALLKYYGQFMVSSVKYFMFGIGMQEIYKKVVPYFPVHDVPHMGLQEVWVAWGIVGVITILFVFWKIILISKHYAKGKRQIYQFVPLVLIIIYTSSGQLLTSSRALMALIIAFICLSVGKNKDTEKSSAP